MAYDKAIAVMTIAAEASSQSHLGRVAVAAVLFNRRRDGRWGNTVAAVCLKRMQFSEWNSDPMDNANLERVAQMGDDDPVIVECGVAYDEAAAGVDPSGGCLWYKRGGAYAKWGVGKGARITINEDGFYDC